MTEESNGQNIDRFRGWAVTVLYGVLGLFSLLLATTTIKLWEYLENTLSHKALLLAACSLSALFCIRSSYRFYRVMKAHVGIPRLHLMPFLLVMIMLVLASKLFAA